jgi:AraC-like DNA-binding protein
VSEGLEIVSERLNEERGFDILGDILETLRFRGSIFFHSELSAPWGMSLSQIGTPRFHIMLSGDCFVGTDGEDAVKVGSSEIIMLPGGNSHWIADRPGRKLISSERAGEACELGNPLFQQGDTTNRLMCGLVHYDQNSSHPILDSLPHILHFPQLVPTDPIWMTATLIDTQIRQTRNRGGPIIDRLTEVLFQQLLNHYVNVGEERTGFLVSLRDRRVHQALRLIHMEPGFDWSLSSLGARIGMSRATLVRRFQDAVGVAPKTYITNWRIMKAYNLIKYSNATLEQIADAVGFSSARTLSKSFQRHYDCTPNELRRAQSAH